MYNYRKPTYNIDRWGSTHALMVLIKDVTSKIFPGIRDNYVPGLFMI